MSGQLHSELNCANTTIMGLGQATHTTERVLAALFGACVVHVYMVLHRMYMGLPRLMETSARVVSFFFFHVDGW